MTIGRKIFIGYLLVLSLLLVAVVVATYSLNEVRSSYDRLIDVNERLADDADAIGLRVRDQVAYFRGAVLYPEFRSQYVVSLESAREQFDRTIARMRDQALSGDELAVLETLVAGAAALEEAQDEVLRLADDVGIEELAGGDFEAAESSNALIDAASAFRDDQIQQVEAGRQRVASTARWLTITMLAIAGAALAAGLGIAVYLGNSITRQLRESVMRLSASAAQILATTAQVASGTAETATAVNETTATVEEVKQTAQVASEKARQVSNSAHRMAEVAQTGRASIEETIAAMHNIELQMESIAASIVQLSERGQAIGEIIATVSDLAEQSNLLAVNAAIEATRAGEHGRGFGVVAQEVRSLAAQSKQATSQVRSILGDIQKATNAAVLATEQGNKAVDDGVDQTKATSDAINQLADSVEAAAEAATQIAASNQQQMVGMDQVALAMDNIKEASSQNVAGTRQAETAAQDLRDLGHHLTSLISRANDWRAIPGRRSDGEL